MIGLGEWSRKPKVHEKNINKFIFGKVLYCLLRFCAKTMYTAISCGYRLKENDVCGYGITFKGSIAGVFAVAHVDLSGPLNATLAGYSSSVPPHLFWLVWVISNGNYAPKLGKNYRKAKIITYVSGKGVFDSLRALCCLCWIYVKRDWYILKKPWEIKWTSDCLN